MYKFDFDYVYSPDWKPAGYAGEGPWFLPLNKPHAQLDVTDPRYVGHYRADKLRYIRKELEGVDRTEALREIVDHILDNAVSDEDRYRRIVLFIQKMMVHLMAEQPMEEDAQQTYRGFRAGMPRTGQGEPYPEDLSELWMRKAFEEAKEFGCYMGVWCNPLGAKFSNGDWGLGGVVMDALELLSLHEGRCGHQAAVAVQLAQVAGMRARLAQVNHHRVAEIMVDGRWRLADPDALEVGFIGTDDSGKPATIGWCADHLEELKAWPVRSEMDAERRYCYYYDLSEDLR